MNSFKCMLMWVTFPELLIEYYDKIALFEIAKIIGEPIKVDYATDLVSRRKYARACIEINTTKALIPQI